jgi:predicted metalloprotease with PDZ domain
VVNQVVNNAYGKPQRMSIADLSRNISDLDIMLATGLYTKGPVLGLLLDAAIRSQTGNRKSLDDVMRYFNEEYGKTGRTFTDDEIIPVMERVTGAKLADFYTRYIAGTEPLPFDEYLPKMGLKIAIKKESHVGFDAVLEQAENGWRIASVKPGGSTDSMGMRTGDVITDITIMGENHPVSELSIPLQYVDQTVQYLPPGVTFSVMRGDKKLTVAAHFIPSMVDVPEARIDEKATGTAREIRRSMLNL